MTAYAASLLNAATLTIVSLWAYFANGMSSETTLIPIIFAVLIAGWAPWMRSGGRVAFAIVTLATLAVFLALFTPLSSSIDKGAALPILRVSAMVLVSGFALAMQGRELVAALRK